MTTTTPSEFLCPITNDIMEYPVIDAEGHTYEREAIYQWLQTAQRSPITRNPLTMADLKPNRALADAIARWRGSAHESPIPSAPPPTPYYNAMTTPVYVCANEYPYQILVDTAPAVVRTRQTQSQQSTSVQGRALRILFAIALTIILLVFLLHGL